MTAIHCHQCGRPNGASVKRCIWCNAQISAGGSARPFDITTLEADYVEGVERLCDPTPVRLIVSPDSIEVVEVLPGSRSIKLPAESILEANLAYSADGEKQTERAWWQSALEPLGFTSVPTSRNGVEGRDFVLTIKYRDGDEVRTGVFTCSDPHGLGLARKLTRILGELTCERQRSEEGNCQLM